MGKIAAAQLPARGRIDTRGIDTRKIVAATATAALGDTLGDAFGDGVKTHDLRGLWMLVAKWMSLRTER